MFLGAGFAFYGYFDLRPRATQQGEFHRWGFPRWVQPAGGALQLVAVLLLVLAGTVAYGAGLLVVMMAFSVYVHLVKEYRPRAVPWPLVLGALAVLTAFLYGAVAIGPVGLVFRAWFH